MSLRDFLLGKKDKTPSQPFISTASIANPSESDPPYVVGMYSATVDRESYLASDENEWVVYTRQALREFRKPGVTLHEEYHMWLAARARARAKAEAAGKKVTGAPVPAEANS